MSKQQNRNEESFWIKLATFVVDKRNLFFLMTLIALVFSFFSRNWVEVENDLAAFLPDSSETRQALDIMDEQFITYGTARVMVSNIAAQQTAHSKRMQVFMFMFLSKMGYGTRHRREKFLVLIKCTTFAGFMQENPARALRN